MNIRNYINGEICHMTNELSAEMLIDLMNEVVNVRSFKKEHIQKEDLRDLLEAFRHGASTANQQPWEILVLNDEQKEKIADSMLDPFYNETNGQAQPWIKDVPTLILITLEERRTKARFGDFGLHINGQDTFTAIQNLRIMASVKGLSTAVIREFKQKEISEILQLPRTFIPFAMVAIGYANEEKEYPPRLSVEEIVHWGEMS